MSFLTHKHIGVAAAAVMASFTFSTAQAADLGGNCCADLEERVAELEATTARKGNRKVSLEVSGHVNEAILFWDDGDEQNVYIGEPVNSRTRFRFKGSAKINADWSAGFLMEFGVRNNNLASVTQSNPLVTTGIDIRHEALYVKSKSYGTVWLGWTGSATEGITEIYLGGNLETPFPLLSGGGLRLRNSTGATIGVSLLNAAGVQGEFKQGEGNRRNMIRYIAPTIAGFSFSAATGGDDFFDVALRYACEFNGFRIAAGVGYQYSSDEDDATGGFRNCAALVGGSSQVDCSQLGASGGIMHVATGLYVNGSYGYTEQENGSEDRDEHWAVYFGIVRKWFALGKTNIWGSYGETDSEIAVVSRNETSADRSVDIFSIGINQKIDAAALELYITYRRIEAESRTNVNTFDANGILSGNGPVSGDLDVDLVQVGARIQF